MNETFIRTAQLLGDQGFSRLSSSVVAVFGLGGVGSHCAEALARSGVGTLFLIDSDTVAPSNINRQSIALLSTVGQKKTDVMKEKIADINPECSVFTSSAFVLPENLREVFSSCPVKPDYIIDAIDTVSAKLALVSYAREEGIPILSSMGTGNKLHPEAFRIGDIYSTSVCPLCRHAQGIKKAGDPRLKGPVFRGDAPQTRNAGRDEGLRPSRSCQHRLCAAGGRAPHSRRGDPGTVRHRLTRSCSSRDRLPAPLLLFTKRNAAFSPQNAASLHVQYTSHYTVPQNYSPIISDSL